MFRDNAASPLAGFHVGPLPWSNWNLEMELEMLVLVEGGKPKYLEKNTWNKTRTINKFNPHVAPGRNRTQATSTGGERSHRCSIPA